MNELWEPEEISKLQQQLVSASSVCEARQKMPETIFTLLNQNILELRGKSNPLPLGREHRAFSVDGSAKNERHFSSKLILDQAARSKKQHECCISNRFSTGKKYSYSFQ